VRRAKSVTWNVADVHIAPTLPQRTHRVRHLSGLEAPVLKKEVLRDNASNLPSPRFTTIQRTKAAEWHVRQIPQCLGVFPECAQMSKTLITQFRSQGSSWATTASSYPMSSQQGLSCYEQRPYSIREHLPMVYAIILDYQSPP
jgi:hypothetical protein